MSLFIESNGSFNVYNDGELVTHDDLPVGTYVIAQDPMTKVLFFKRADHVTVPAKMYGDTEVLTDKILRTTSNRSGSTGVLLSGAKGSGKTLLAKNLSVVAREKYRWPTIIVNSPWAGPDFNRLLQAVKTPVVVMFDEFEKIYGWDTQQELLTVLDGTTTTNKLFVMTCNNLNRVSEFLINRPGRIFYAKKYEGVSVEFIREYCADNLNNVDDTDGIVRISAAFQVFNFDTMQALVEEMNRYKQTAYEAMELLNIEPSDNGGQSGFEITFTGVNKKIRNIIAAGDGLGKIVQLNPMGEFSVEITYEYKEGQKWKTAYSSVDVDPSMIVDIQPDRGYYNFDIAPVMGEEFEGILMEAKRVKEVSAFNRFFNPNAV